MSTNIEWTDETWNCVTGCSKVSPGCAHCYAETVALRFWPTQYPPITLPTGDQSDPLNVRPRQFTDVMTHEDRLDQPLRWKKPRRIFVNSMSDLFHEDVPDSFIDCVFAVMALTPQHTFQILTKRAERMRQWSEINGTGGHIFHVAQQVDPKKRGARSGVWPLPNVWLGVSVENQHFADERMIPLLLQTPAAVRFISAEPLLGAVNLDRFTCGSCGTSHARSASTKAMKSMCPDCSHCDEHTTPDNRYWLGASPSARATGRGLDWIIAGGESGPQARPCDVAWIRSIIQQCAAAGVPCFVKQLGADAKTPFGGRFEFRDRKGGDPEEWPVDLRVREFPTGRAAPAGGQK